MATTRRKFVQASTGTAGALLSGCFKGGGEKASSTLETGKPLVEDFVPTTCWIGKQDCGMLARRMNGRLIGFQGHPDHPRNRGTLCPKGIAQIMAVYDPNRVKTPLIRTNEKGIPGHWRPASWEEALSLVGDKIKDVRSRDPRLLVWQKGRSKAKAFYDKAFVAASGATKLHHGAFCSDAGYRACEYTIGLHGVLHPDFRDCNYVLAWGWNITNAGGNKLCQITWPQQLVAARERGMKVIAIDPRLRGAAHFADKWLPIRPATDLALSLTLCNLLIQQGTVDREYLIKHTNAAFLVKEDGYFFRGDQQQKEHVWDQASGSAQPHDTAGIDWALEGEFEVGGIRVKPAFQVFKEQIAQHSAEWAAEVCGISAELIQNLARELGENALIGSTRMKDGVSLPYRPVAISTYHMVQQELGFQLTRSMLQVTMLLGSVGAVGGQCSDFTWKIHDNFKKLDNIKIKDPPYNVYLKDSKFFPINSNNSSLAAKVMLDPEKYGVDTIPEVMIIHMANPLVSFPDQAAIAKSYMKLKFIAVIDPWLSKTADYFADVVLPAATVEKYEGPINATDQYTEATTLRIPPMDPLFDSKGDIDIYLDLCEKAGILYGKNGYLAQVNKELKLKPPHLLPLDRKTPVREIFDHWAKSEGIEEGVAYFEEHGVKIKGPVAAKKFYGCAGDPPFGGVRHRFYGESLLRYRDEMKAKGVEEIYWRDYTALPVWRQPTMDDSPDQFDLYLISYKKIEFKGSRASQIPLLAELAPKQGLEINPKTAKARGVKEGDSVWVESHNAITGETRKINIVVSFRESIRPDTIGIPNHYGEVARHPWTKGQGATPNEIFFTGEGYVSNTADQSFHVKCRVYKSSEETS